MLGLSTGTTNPLFLEAVFPFLIEQKEAERRKGDRSRDNCRPALPLLVKCPPIPAGGDQRLQPRSLSMAMCVLSCVDHHLVPLVFS